MRFLGDNPGSVGLASPPSNGQEARKTLRVLYLTINPNRISTTMPTECWFRLLRPRGLEPVLVSQTLGAFHQWATEQGIPSYHAAMPFPSKAKFLPFVHSLWRLRGLVKRHGVQLIHVNEQEIYPIGQYLARWCRLPVVVSVHFTMDRGFCEWAFRSGRQPQRIFFTSQGNLEACRKGVTGIVDEAAWRLLYNGLDLDHFRPDPELGHRFRREHSLEGKPLIGIACALRPRKQVQHLFEMASRLTAPGLRVLVAGAPVAGDEAYAEKLMAEGRQKLGDQLIHLGHLNDLRGFYNALDVYVNTSREEACSLGIIETLGCGCPVVGYPSTSVHEQVLPGGGEIVEQNNLDQLTACVSRWLDNPKNMESARRGSRQRAELHFDYRKTSEQLWNEYLTLIP